MPADIAEYLEGLAQYTEKLGEHTIGLDKRLGAIEKRPKGDELPRFFASIGEAQELLQRLGRWQDIKARPKHVYDDLLSYYLDGLPGIIVTGRDTQQTLVGQYAPAAFVDITSPFYLSPLVTEFFEELYDSFKPEEVGDGFLTKINESMGLKRYIMLEELAKRGLPLKLVNLSLGGATTARGASSYARGITGGINMVETEDRPNYVGHNELPVKRGDPKKYKETRTTEIEMK